MCDGVQKDPPIQRIFLCCMYLSQAANRHKQVESELLAWLSAMSTIIGVLLRARDNNFYKGP